MIGRFKAPRSLVLPFLRHRSFLKGAMSTRVVHRYHPALFLAESSPPECFGPPDLLILNQPITGFAFFSRLWKHAGYRICADGGANRLYDMFNGATEAHREDYVRKKRRSATIAQTYDCQLPDCIHGDLDSLRDDVRDYYASHGVDVSQDHDQESTDFGKTMQKIKETQPTLPRREVLVLGRLGGRVDQGLGLLHEMLREENKDPGVRLWLLSESSVSFILQEGYNSIDGLKSGLFTKYTGLVPIYGPATITTSGLEWDIKDWDTQMGTKVSTSNHVMSDEVQVQTSGPILFTIERSPILGAESESKMASST